MKQVSELPSDLVGAYRRIGTIGPAYQIIGVGHECIKGDSSARIVILESGEETDYPLAAVLTDPEPE